MAIITISTEIQLVLDSLQQLNIQATNENLHNLYDSISRLVRLRNLFIKAEQEGKEAANQNGSSSEQESNVPEESGSEG